MYQRAFLHWNRAAIQGDVFYILAFYVTSCRESERLDSEVVPLGTFSLDNFQL